ncbi:MAG: non-canonical purine NTP pyrophosphatase, RdgB/HAM1 family [Bdellovibrionales bacterium RIFCSPHIGHO2_01_FULL_40_29]|nr:MAG: non-canonical purine NTP pyrophosphatase, RdgB/HAM1 family [Bdellovibrionales bacterium RIFCSPHIGHO2_01_FULL_40_29]OFZ33807.1 MAG: non-canonical purine NTP pyrophosphatase, RdgB/HAM1 family [Bdellovibrionales bacterium RIFCSPHIGHO2_02_FULL_40_15]
MELWIATGNKGKLEEYKLTLNKIPSLAVFSQADLPSFTPRPEDGTTFLENARIKAKSVKALKSAAYVLGEDAGLEVEGLGNLPGIHSARYAGPHARDSENVAKLLKMMQIRNINPRTAQFKCVTVVLTPDNEEWIFEGVMKGTISTKVSGLMGFGYDPVFIPEGETKTLAELGPGYKIQKSHRAQALSQFLTQLNKKGL